MVTRLEDMGLLSDRFDGKSRGDTGKDEILTAAEKQLLETGVEAPEGADRFDAISRPVDDIDEELSDSEKELLATGADFPVPPTFKPSGTASNASIAAKPRAATSAPATARAQQQAPAAEAGADELNRHAAEQWKALQQAPNFRARADQLIAAERQRDPEPLREEVVQHLEWQQREHDRELRGIRAANQMAAEYDSGMRVLNTVRQQEDEWSKANPDYHDRVNFMRERRDRELQTMGYTDPAQRERIILENAAMILRNAIRQGQNPAAVIHAMSEAQGFRPSSQAAAVRQGAPGGTRTPAAARGGRRALLGN
jgi:hypothetical protein